MLGLQKTLDIMVKEYSSPSSILLRLLNRRFEALGISLSDLQQENISKQILEFKGGTINIEFEDGQVTKAGFSKEGEIKTLIQSIFDSLPVDIKDFSKDFEEEFPKTLQNIISEVAPIVLKSLKKSASEMLIDRMSEQERFRNNLMASWREAIDLLKMYLVIAIEDGEYANKDWMPTAVDENNIVFDVLTRLHARACQISSKIITLLENGFADGAHARWRSLHEVTVVASFIVEGGRELAERYILHENVESYKAALQYQDYCCELGLEEITKGEIDSLIRTKDELVKRFGKDYKNAYGWASDILGVCRT